MMDNENSNKKEIIFIRGIVIFFVLLICVGIRRTFELSYDFYWGMGIIAFADVLWVVADKASEMEKREILKDDKDLVTREDVEKMIEKSKIDDGKKE